MTKNIELTLITLLSLIGAVLCVHYLNEETRLENINWFATFLYIAIGGLFLSLSVEGLIKIFKKQ